LAAGKGVTVCETYDEAVAAIDRLAPSPKDPEAGRGGPWVVIEERLIGPEASVIALSDGRDAVVLPPARDHKRLADGDQGPNTGGMAAYSPLANLADDAAPDIVETFHRPILAELARRGSPFRGALYAGLMLTEDGPVLLECNARFGDPETQAIMPRLAVALGPLLLAAARGHLRDARVRPGLGHGRLPTLPGATVALVLAAAGYPAQPRTGDLIDGLDAAKASGALVFHAGTARDADGTTRIAGGRVLSVVARGPDVAAAEQAASTAADMIHAPGLQRRHDIGRDVAQLAVGSGSPR
ncbi:MAG: phosphoribosylamine--glycine ligase, partial [Chloroflexota bacterium]